MPTDVDLDAVDASVTHTLELYDGIIRTGNCINLFIPSHGEYKKYKENKAIYIQVSRLIPYQLSLFINYIKFCINNGRPDVIYTRSFTSAFIIMLFSTIFRIPYIIERNGLGSDEMKLRGVRRISIVYFKLIEYISCKISTKIVTVTPNIKDILKKKYNLPEERFEVIGNGANTTLFNHINQNEAKRLIALDENLNYVCFVGNLAPWQGVEYIIKSAPTILDKFPNTRFLIIGDGIMRNYWESLTVNQGVREKFIFTGAIPYKQAPIYINACDLCIAPFIIERNKLIGLSPLKIYEYLSCKKAVVASDISGVSELLRRSNGGIIVTPENPNEIANAVVYLLKDKKLRDEMGENGRNYIIKNHSWDIVARSVISLCEQVLKDYK